MRRPIHRVALTCLLAAMPVTLATAAKPTEQPYAYGPPPEWGHYRAMAEFHIKAMLVDPDSAQFTWPYGYAQSEWKPVLEPRVHGYVSCGLVNSRNRMGGYAGADYFVVVIDDDRVLFAEIGGRSSFADELCIRAIQRGTFPPVSNMPQLVTEAAPPRYGFTISSVPDGAYIASVVSGSPADKAGLKQGMVLAQLNGLSLKGLAVATIDQMLAAADGVVTVSVIGGATLKIARMPEAAATPAQVTPHTRPVQPGPDDRF